MSQSSDILSKVLGRSGKEQTTEADKTHKTIEEFVAKAREGTLSEKDIEDNSHFADHALKVHSEHPHESPQEIAKKVYANLLSKKSAGGECLLGEEMSTTIGHHASELQSGDKTTDDVLGGKPTTRSSAAKGTKDKAEDTTIGATGI